MIVIEPLDTAAARPQPHGTGHGKAPEPEPSRPVQGTTESLDSGLDVNRDRNANDRKVDDQGREADPDAKTYDARGNARERPSDPPPQTDGETVDLFV